MYILEWISIHKDINIIINIINNNNNAVVLAFFNKIESYCSVLQCSVTQSLLRFSYQIFISLCFIWKCCYIFWLFHIIRPDTGWQPQKKNCFPNFSLNIVSTPSHGALTRIMGYTLLEIEWITIMKNSPKSAINLIISIILGDEGWNVFFTCPVSASSTDLL